LKSYSSNVTGERVFSDEDSLVSPEVRYLVLV
jgi:hypothetical protein